MKITKADIIIILALFILTVLSFKVMSRISAQGNEAHVHIEGKLTHKIDLSVDKEYSVDVQNGNVTIKVAGGKLYITEADCPRKICIDDSPISMKGESLICVPNKLVIGIEGGSDGLDTITQ